MAALASWWDARRPGWLHPRALPCSGAWARHRGLRGPAQPPPSRSVRMTRRPVLPQSQEARLLVVTWVLAAHTTLNVKHGSQQTVNTQVSSRNARQTRPRGKSQEGHALQVLFLQFLHNAERPMAGIKQRTCRRHHPAGDGFAGNFQMNRVQMCLTWALLHGRLSRIAATATAVWF